MLPQLYLRCLELIQGRDGLQPSRFIRAQLAEIISLEHELQASLPHSYEQHLLHVGTGHEHGGLAVWFHIDPTRPGNLLERNREIHTDNGRPGAPEDFLAVHDSLDGTFFGFCRQGAQFTGQVYCWCPEESDLSLHTESLGSFYRERVDLDQEEINALSVTETGVPG